MLAKVRDKVRNITREVTAKAYNLIPHRYELLGWLNDDGTPADGPPSSKELNLGAAKAQKKSAAPAAVSIDLPKTPIVTREDLDRLNQEAIDKVKAEAALEPMAYIPPAIPAEEVVEEVVDKKPTPKKKAVVKKK